jgi:hypothetical protein
VFSNRGINHSAPQLLQPGKRSLFINANQPAVTSNIGG